MKKVFLWVLGIFVALWMFGMIISAFHGSGKLSMSHVRYYCEKAVGQRLKAPSTASYSGQYETQIYELTPGQRYRVVGHVDAQNSFGAMLRMPYNCEIQFTGSQNETPQILNLILAGR
jgi:hypothetical protein